MQSQSLGDSSGQSGFTMVNVADGTNVNMGFGSFKFCLCHLEFPPLYLEYGFRTCSTRVILAINAKNSSIRNYAKLVFFAAGVDDLSAMDFGTSI